MATWMTHIRISEKLLETLKLDEKMFLVGNLGPDCNINTDDFSAFRPTKDITHWIDASINNPISKINSENFYRIHLEQTNLEDIEKYSFLLGYYTHLLTDIEWSRLHRKQRQENPEYHKKLIEDKKFIWEVKKDWYGIDFKYLKDNKNNSFHRVFKHLSDVPVFLDYFSKHDFNRKIEYIKEYYLHGGEETNDTFTYISDHMVQKFIDNTSEHILSVFSEKELMTE